MAYKNKSDEVAAKRRHYDANKELIKSRALLHKKAQQKILREYIRATKLGKACMDCEIEYPYYVMDYDHVRGTKKRAIAQMISRAVSIKTMQEEIDKCDLVCSNCHRERTHK